jgi:glycosyltransferase involved in cell wall biosynthesis
LPLGIDLRFYQVMSKESSRRQLIKNKIIPQYLENKFIVLYAGTLNRVTRVENLFYAANKIKESEKDIVFLVVGEGDEKQRLEELAVNEKINNVVLLPFVPRSLVSLIISAADACVITLSPEPAYKATIPTKFFDYLACGKPQIGICEGELADLINSNKIGVTVRDGEIDNLVNVVLRFRQSSLLEQMEKNSHSVVQRFSLEFLASQLEEVLRKRMF